MLHLFSLDIIQETKSESNKNEMKTSVEQKNESESDIHSKSRETGSKVLQVDVKSQSGNIIDENNIASKRGENV